MELRKLSTDELTALLKSEETMQLFFEANVPLVGERQELIDQVKMENVRLARTNFAEAGELTKIEKEVDGECFSALLILHCDRARFQRMCSQRTLYVFFRLLVHMLVWFRLDFDKRV